MMKIKLSQDEKEVLEEAIRDIKIDTFYKIIDTNLDFFYLEGDEDTLIDLREYCSDYLIIVGFDDDYQPNKKGKILEDLIDKLFTD